MARDSMQTALHDLEARAALLDCARRMQPLGINRGTSGNVSCRVPGGFLITPSGIAYDDCTAQQVVDMDLDGTPRSAGTPSTEWRFHRDIYRAHDACGAVVHTHSPYATTLACMQRDIPAFHYMVAAAGGNDIRCAGYATFGTQELSARALEALQGRRACLLAHHGVIATGSTLERALALAVEVEHLAQMYWAALQLGTPPILDAREMQRVIARFATYGPQADTQPPV